MSAMVDSLSAVPLFADLSRRDLKRLAESMKELTFASGKEVVTQGKGGAAFFVILEGAARVTQGGEDRALLTAGDYMPADMQRAFWKSLLDFTNDQSQLDSILANLDQVQASSYAPAASPS